MSSSCEHLGRGWAGSGPRRSRRWPGTPASGAPRPRSPAARLVAERVRAGRRRSAPGRRGGTRASRAGSGAAFDDLVRHVEVARAVHDRGRTGRGSRSPCSARPPPGRRLPEPSSSANSSLLCPFDSRTSTPALSRVVLDGALLARVQAAAHAEHEQDQRRPALRPQLSCGGPSWSADRPRHRSSGGGNALRARPVRRGRTR